VLLRRVENGAGPVDWAAHAGLVNGLAAALHLGQGLHGERAVERVAEVLVVQLAFPALLAEADLAGV
jgi:hypothetical protein